MTPLALNYENRLFKGSGGVSQHNRRMGFRSAFLDRATGCIYLSRFADGRLAPMHLLDGLPEELVTGRDAAGRICAVKQSVIAGFLHADDFYTREQAARLVASVQRQPEQEVLACD